MTMAPSLETAPNQGSGPPHLPVIIVGAGPCGLVTALALKHYGITNVCIIEKATRTKICSNAGSGFELAPTAVEILQNRLKIDVSKIMSYYRGMGILTMKEGKLIRASKLAEDYDGGSVNRAELQQHLLELLFPTTESEEGILVCGSGLDYYQENTERNTVTVTLENGRKLEGSLLLGCDGIHSRVRAVLHGGYDPTKDRETNKNLANVLDPLHYCGAMAYWGKTRAPPKSRQSTEFFKIANNNDMIHDKNDSSVGVVDSNTKSFFLIALTTRTVATSCFVIPSHNNTMLNWAITVRKKNSSNKNKNPNSVSASIDFTGDLTRRGGGRLTQQDKDRLFDFSNNSSSNSESVVQGVKDFPLLQELIKQTPPEDITEAGLYDRTKLDLPYTSSSNLVALLGDAAHPQTPFLGQGVNMAICDAYVYATNIALARNNTENKDGNNPSLRQAMDKSDTDFRRRSAKKVIKEARWACVAAISSNWFVRNFMKLYAKHASTEEFMDQFARTDRSNREYLRYLDTTICSRQKQLSMME